MLPYVLSSRVRLARNLTHYPFPALAHDAERAAVLRCVEQAAAAMEWFPRVTGLHLDTLAPLERRLLEEQHLISPTFAAPGRQRLALIDNAADFSILVNEEDHLRIHSILPGFQVAQAGQIVTDLERSLTEKLDFAYSDREGYLTACTSNRGAGIRVSVMLFLPGLMASQRLIPLLQQITAAGYTVRGWHGEGSPSSGHLLQLSRHVRHAKEMDQDVRRLEAVCVSVIEQERRIRQRMLRRSGKNLKRHLQQEQERMNSALRIGLQTGMRWWGLLRFETVLRIERRRLEQRSERPATLLNRLKQLDALLIQIQPAHVMWRGLQSSQFDRSVVSDESGLRARILQRVSDKKQSRRTKTVCD